MVWHSTPAQLAHLEVSTALKLPSLSSTDHYSSTANHDSQTSTVYYKKFAYAKFAYAKPIKKMQADRPDVGWACSLQHLDNDNITQLIVLVHTPHCNMYIRFPLCQVLSCSM